MRRSPHTVAGFLLEDWLPAVRHGFKATVAAQYEDYLRAYVVPTIGETRLQDLTARRLSALYGHLLDAGRIKRRPGGSAGLAPKTVRNIHSLLHKAFTDAVAWRLVPRNVADDARPPRVRRDQPGVWEPAQLRAFLDGTRGDRFHPLYLLATTTGMRRAELCGLRWADVDLSRALLCITETRAVVRGHVHDDDPKTRHSSRPLALDPATVAALRAHRQRQEDERATFGSGWRNTAGRVFTWEDGRPVHPDVIRQRFARHVEQLGPPRLGLHGLRHSYATAALEAGVSPKVISEWLGHASVAFTLAVYAHALPRHDRDAAHTVAALVLGTHAAPAVPTSVPSDDPGGAAA